MSTPDLQRHNCTLPWCEASWSDRTSHWRLEYTRASLRSGDPYHLTDGHTPHKVGIGLTYEEGDLPCIVVHIDGGPRDDDVDAHLKISEAVALRELLDHGISAACDALQHMTTQMVGHGNNGGPDAA